MADERIFVIKRAHIAHDGIWSGLRHDILDRYQAVVREKGEFQWRSAMETDSRYKQIIPYMIFTYNDAFFLMQRKSNATESRLQEKFSLGIGGHMREEDVAGTTIFEWAQREFLEEVTYDGSLTVEPLGVINDESNAVGQVHLGFALLLRGDSGCIQPKSEFKQGMLVDRMTCATYIDRMEPWSQLVWARLQQAYKSCQE